MRVRLAELVGVLSLATDLGLGLPEEHVLRQCRIAMGLGARLGLDDGERAAVYYVALLAWVGCTADSHELAAQFGDDIALRADSHQVDLAGLPLLGFLARHAGSGSGPLGRARHAAALAATRGRVAADAMTAHCQVASAVAFRLGLGPEVQEPLVHAFARWDGRGVPAGRGGEDLPLAIRLVHLASVTEVHHHAAGTAAAVAVARDRSGTQFDPRLVEAFADCAADLLDPLDDGSSWDAVIAAEPGLSRILQGDELDEAMTSIADFADLKSPWLTGHSRGVARLAAETARGARLPADEVIALRRAGLVHDVGRSGVSNAIWDKPGPLTAAEWERVRLHPYYTQRMLARSAALADLGAIAGSHHERQDGSGYHRGVPGAVLPPAARILAAADAYHAMTEPRPHRPAPLSAGEAARVVRDEVRGGKLDADAVEEVLLAAGHDGASPRERARPAGLTARELEVLLLVARGASSRDVARALVIADKTARNHIERIYLKLGVSTRAEASLFAMRHGLVA